MGNAKTVLILIILEYIYITLSKKKEIAAGVLILIILEYIYINMALFWVSKKES
ncbi:putative membrane protein [Bacteroides fragilis str. S23 R14]|nr:putative membrane protein [Bacteroides fragilis str. S23 R14]